jgi:hypothetical protein
VEGFDVAQICLNGHIVSEYAGTDPSYGGPFCTQCGAATIEACPKCNAPIRGHYHTPGVISFQSIALPSYCHACGEPYPWTPEKIRAALELWVEESSATPEDAKQFQETLTELAKDSPRTQLAASRFKKAMTKVANPVASGIRDIIVDIISETAKKAIWPGKP